MAAASISHGQSRSQTYKETLVISQFQVQLQGFNYKIDDQLNISTIRKYAFNILPEVTRLNNTTGEAPKRLPDGPCFVRLTLFKGDRPDIQSGDFIAAANAKSYFVDSSVKVANVLGGRIIANFEFDIRDLTVPGARNTLAIEIYPLNANSKMEPKIHFTQFVPASESSFGIISGYKNIINGQNPRDVLAKIVNDSKLEQEKNRNLLSEAVSIAAFTKNSNLEMIELSQTKLPYDLDQTILTDLINQGLVNLVPESPKVAELAKNTARLCHQAYVENLGFWGLKADQIPFARKPQFEQALKVANDCRLHPFKYFDFDQKIHIKKIDPRIRFLGGSTQNFNINSSFDLNTSQLLSTSLRQGATASFSVGTKLLNIFRTGAGVVPLLKDIFSASVDYSLSQDSSLTESQSESHGHSVAFSRGLYLVEQQAGFEINVTKYTPCISILTKENIVRKLFGDGFVPFAGFHICGEPQDKNISIAETYYFFSQHFASGDFLDSRSLENRPFVMSLRGLRDYFVFLNLNNAVLKAKEMADVEKSNPKAVIIAGMDLFSHQQKAYPGIYSAVTKPSQLTFLSQTSPNSKAQELFSQLGKTLSPWTRKELRPLDNLPTGQ